MVPCLCGAGTRSEEAAGNWPVDFLRILQPSSGVPHSNQAQVQATAAKVCDNGSPAPLQASNKAKAKPKQAGTNQTAAVSEDRGRRCPYKACPSCDMDSHRIQACRKFKALPLADRLEIAKRKGLCFRCLNWGHMSKDCDATCSLCDRRHHDQLHDPERERAPQESNQAQVLTAMVSKAEVKKVSSTDDAGSDEEEIQASEGQVWMCILPVIVHGKNADVTTYAFMDSGYSTLMTRGLFQQLGLEGHPIDYSIRTLNDKQLCRR